MDSKGTCASAMIYLLYGSDTKSSLKKLQEIISEYRRKNGDLNIYKFDAEEDETEKIRTVLQTHSLFASKKLVVIKHLTCSEDQEYVNKLLKYFKDDNDTLRLLWER
jgi:DNA polymerase III delta subunit